MPLMIESYAGYLDIAGLVLIIAGSLGFLARPLRIWRKGLLPLALVGCGLIVTGFPLAYRAIAPVNLGPREKIVEGQRHITLTGWDRKDYGFLGSKHDVIVLQMANPDVTDQTLEELRKMDHLEELDLSNTQVTDAGLKVLKDLPALRSLRLKNTKITDLGFRQFLVGKDSLMQLDLSGTAVSQETAQAWRKDRAGRRVLR
jgi:Leucine-rich repeat (LRR) protein